MKVKFLGTNGWFSTKTGSTPCVVAFAKDRLIVFDAGTGFSRVGEECRKAGVKRIDLFLSHLHLDHTEGLHTLPILPRGLEVRIFVHKGYEKKLRLLLDHPFTMKLERNSANVKIVTFGKSIAGVPYKITVLPLVHADPCFGFRLELGGKTLAYCTDTGPCENIAALAKNADLLVIESTLPPGMPLGKHGSWPHLSPDWAAAQAKKAGARRLALTHFDASKYASAALRKRAGRMAGKIFGNTIAAKDGLVIGV